jgi:multiple sugar transport system substrate-binding protein
VAAQDAQLNPDPTQKKPADSSVDQSEKKPALEVEELYAPSEEKPVTEPVKEVPKLSTEKPEPQPTPTKEEPPKEEPGGKIAAQNLPPAPTEGEPPPSIRKGSGSLSPALPAPPSQPAPPVSPPPPPPETSSSDESFSFVPPQKSSLKGLLKIFIPLLVLAAIAVVVLFFWPGLLKSDKTKVSFGDQTLSYWGLWEDEDIMKGIIADWEEEHPKVKVKYIRHSKEEYRERLASALIRDEGPDIFRFHNSWLPMFRDELAPMPSSVMSVDQFEETFYKVAANDLKIGSSAYGLPLEIDTLALFYNEELFRAAGKTPPSTWDELLKRASELTVRNSKDEIQIAGIGMGGSGNIDHWSDILGLMMLQNGVDLKKPKGRLAEDTLTFYTYFLNRDKVWNVNFPNSTLAFAGGKVAMFFGFSWDVFEIQRLNPSLKFGIVPAPQLPEREPVAWASYWIEGVAKRSGHQEAAWEFLKYLTSAPVMKKLYETQSRTRLFGEPYSRKDLASELENDPLVAPFIKQAPFARSWYLCSRTFDNGLNKSMIKYFENAVNSTNKTKNATQALEAASKGVGQVLSRYQISR